MTTSKTDVTEPGADPGFPIGGAPTLVGGGANLRHRCFSVKTYVKTKEFGPVGGGAPETFVCRSATVSCLNIFLGLLKIKPDDVKDMKQVLSAEEK